MEPEQKDYRAASSPEAKWIRKNRVKLTKREKEVLENIILGLTSLEIAEKLFVSINTVETHRKNIIQKLRANNMVDAVVKAMRIGLIELEMLKNHGFQ